MEELKVQLVDDALLVEDFIRLKLATGFMNRPLNQIEDALKNGLFDVSAILQWEGHWNGPTYRRWRYVLVLTGYQYSSRVPTKRYWEMHCEQAHRTYRKYCYSKYLH